MHSIGTNRSAKRQEPAHADTSEHPMKKPPLIEKGSVSMQVDNGPRLMSDEVGEGKLLPRRNSTTGARVVEREKQVRWASNVPETKGRGELSPRTRHGTTGPLRSDSTEGGVELEIANEDPKSP